MCNQRHTPNRRLSFEPLAARRLLAGDLDPQFADFGWLADPIVHPAASEDYAQASVTDASGRILILGDTTGTQGGRNLISLTRLLPSGELDDTFTYGLQRGDESAVDLTVQQNGRIVLLVNVRRNDSNRSGSHILVGLQPNGKLDESFGAGGIVEGNYDYPNHLGAGALTTGPNDEIYVHFADPGTLYLSKYNGDGSRDTSFGVDGTFSYPSTWPEPQDVVVDGAGGIVLASTFDNETNYAAVLVRVDNEGTLDSSFGSEGTVTIATTDDQRYSNYGRLRLSAFESGDFLVAGMRRTGTEQDFFTRKLTAAGQPVNAFGSNGEAFIESGHGWGTLLQDLVIDDSEGSIYLTGTLGISRTPFVAELDSEGNLSPRGLISESQTTNDRGLGGAVWLSDRERIALTFTSNDDLSVLSFVTGNSDFAGSETQWINVLQQWGSTEGNDILELPDGKLLTSSTDWYREESTGPYKVYLSRFLPNGMLDLTYGVQGRIAVDAEQFFGRIPNPFFASETEQFLAIQDGYDLRIARLNESGEIDTSFGIDGWITWPLPSGSMTITQIDSITATQDGFLITGGGRTAIANDGYLIVKLDRAGNAVESFGDAGQIKIPHQPAAGRDSQVQLQSDGKFLLMLGHEDRSRSVTVRRYSSDGLLDTSFATDGILKTGFSAFAAMGRRHLRVLDNGDFLILAGRSQFQGPGTTPHVVKYSFMGELDSDFGIRPLPVHLSETLPQDLLVDSQSRIVVLASASDSWQDDPVVYRLHPDGELDATFGDAGSRRIARNGNDDTFTRLAETRNGDLLLAGSSVGEQFQESTFLRLLENPPQWHNAGRAHDVSDDGSVSALDALLVINRLNAGAGGSLPSDRPDDSPFFDVNGDNAASPIDALLVINRLNSRGSGEGEGESAADVLPWDHFYANFDYAALNGKEKQGWCD